MPRSLLASAVLLVAACGAPASSADPSPDSTARIRTPIRIVTWNVHDLFDEVDRTTSPGEADTVLPASAVEAKLAAIARVLRRIDADVAILQEVENESLLRRLVDGPLAGSGYRTFLREGFDPRGIDVGVLSRIAFDPGPSHLEDRAPDGHRLWARDPVEVHLRLGSTSVSLVVVGAHLVSRLDPADDDRRRLQAARLRAIADGLRAGQDEPCVLVVGDLNDLPEAPALEPLLADGSWRDLGRALSPAAAWTWTGAGLHERMDYALVPTPDAPLVTRIAVEEGPDVAAASDHRPLAIDVWVDARGAR